MAGDLRITLNDDKSITVSETDLTGKRITFVVAAADAHDYLVSMGAKCPTHEHVEQREITAIQISIDTDDPALSPETKAELEQVGIPVLTDTKIDHAERRVLHEELDVLWSSRELLMQDPTAEDRNDRLDAIDEKMKIIRETLIFLDVLVGSADEPYNGQARDDE